MKKEIAPISVCDLELNYIGDDNFKATYIAGLNNADNECITFSRSLDLIEISKIEAGILIVDLSIKNKIDKFKSKAIAFSENPKYHFIDLIAQNYDNNFELSTSNKWGEDETILVSKYAFIEKNVILGSNTQIYPQVSIFCDTVIGLGCTIQSGSVLGGIGLGDVFHDGKYHKFVHVGNVEIHDNVSIGTNVSILKGMLQGTIIGEGTKIGNNVNIGHNVVIGKNCYISSGVTIGGACVIEDGCWIAPGVSINDHIHIQKNCKIGTGAVLIKDALPNSFYLGNPARRISDRVD